MDYFYVLFYYKNNSTFLDEILVCNWKVSTRIDYDCFKKGWKIFASFTWEKLRKRGSSVLSENYWRSEKEEPQARGGEKGCSREREKTRVESITRRGEEIHRRQVPSWSRLNLAPKESLLELPRPCSRFRNAFPRASWKPRSNERIGLSPGWIERVRVGKITKDEFLKTSRSKLYSFKWMANLKKKILLHFNGKNFLYKKRK